MTKKEWENCNTIVSTGRKRVGGIEMLTKRQLEDAAECLARFHERTCGQCSCNKFRYGYVGSYGCTENAAQTALAYREMLERARKTLKDSGYLVNDEIYASGKNSQCKEMTGNYSKEVVEEAIDRLAEYEETGLTPEEVTEMINRFESFVSEMTGNRMSKSSYTVKAMVDAAEDYQQSLCEECWDRKQLAKHHEMERDGRCVVLDEEMVIRAVEKAILVNSDEKKYRYELGKDCLIPCCQDAYKYLIAEREKGAEHDRD